MRRVHFPVLNDRMTLLIVLQLAAASRQVSKIYGQSVGAIPRPSLRAPELVGKSVSLHY